MIHRSQRRDVARSEHLSTPLQRLLKERKSTLVVALSAVHLARIIQALECVWVEGAELFLAYGKYLLRVW